MEQVKNILITGVTGYLGSNFAKNCLSNGISVHTLVRSKESEENLKKQFNSITVHQIPERVEDFSNLLINIGTDTVVHLASYFVSDHIISQVDQLVESNLIFPSYLIESCYRANIKNFINAGSVGQHFNNEIYNPVCLYAAQKQAVEDILTYYVSVSEMKVITLKIYDTYGPNDNRPKILNLLSKYANSDQQLNLSSRDQKIHLVHIDDIVSAFHVAIKLAVSSKAGSIKSYSLPSKESTTIEELCELYEKLTNKKINKAWGVRKIKGLTKFDLWSKEVTLPGWNPVIELEEGIKQLIVS